MKYIGTKKTIGRWKGNYDEIWIKYEDGKYRTKGKSFSLTQEQIDSDVRNGYLVKLEEV